MIIQVVKENPLTVLVDGVPAEVLTYHYLDHGVKKTCQYVKAGGKNVPIKYVGEPPVIP